MKMPKEIIREEICKSGVISFARFMELALYCPETGYYESHQDKVGRGGDFITSVSTGSLFGELLGYQLAEWLEELPLARGKRRVLEAGAHDGRLAADILGWWQRHRPQLFPEVEYVICEPSPRRREWQRQTLAPFAGQVRWISDLTDPVIQPFNGIIFSNELLDAFPVHRFGWDAGQGNWFEWGVALAGEGFCWARLSPEAALKPWPEIIRDLPGQLLEVLPDEYVVETSPAAEAWWRRAAGTLANGRLLALDYGFAADDMFSPSRHNGTVRGYHRHHHADDVLAHPGEQDLTAHVNFSTMRHTGEAAGLLTENYLSQTKFLTQILIQAHTNKNFGEWSSARTRQFQTLTHPDHLGHAFRVLVQVKP